jgi:23S rRNA pseudouridine1911/1915/1917 synthase
MRAGKPRIPPGAPGHPKMESRNAPASRRVPARPAPGPAAERPARPSPAQLRAQAPARLVYEDEELLAYDKPSGLPVISADGSRSKCLLDIATARVRLRNPKGRAAVVHRIDRDSSGIVVFAANAKVKKELMGSWDELVAERRYVALVEGAMDGKSGSFDSWLKENKAGQVFRAATGERGAKRAITRWRLLGVGAGLSLLELRLETGRKHQIRVQLSDSGHPIVGDERYGHRHGSGVRHISGVRGGSAGPYDPGRLCLHAESIELRMPGRQALKIESPAPPEFAAALGRAPAVPRASEEATRAMARATGKRRPSGLDGGDKRRPSDPDGGDKRRPSGLDGGDKRRPSGLDGGAFSSRSAGRSVAPPRRVAPRGKKPSSRP